MSRFKRRGGSKWRVLVHGSPLKGERMYGPAHHFSSFPMTQRSSGLPEELQSRYTIVPDTEFDEVVVGQWCHIEAMSANTYWMNIAGVTLIVTCDRDGKATRCSLYTPGNYANPEPDCRYTIDEEETRP